MANRAHQMQDTLIAQATERLAADPNSADAALNLFKTLTRFNQRDPAQDLANALLRQFSTNSAIHFAIGGWYDSLQRKPEADALFQRALQLDPNNIMAKRAVVIGHLENNDPNRAQQLLDAPPAILVQHMPDVYFSLGKAYQTQHRHQEALQLFQQIIGVNRSALNDAKFRGAVQQSEKALGAAASLLPTIPLFRRPAVVVPAIVAAVALALFGISAYIAQHRSLSVVNGFESPVQIALDQNGPFELPPFGHKDITVAEGPHHVVVKFGDKLLREDDFTLDASFFGRIFKRPEFTLNAAGGAVLCREVTTYSENPQMAPPPKDDIEIYGGSIFSEIEGVNFRYQEFPQNLKIKKGETANRSRIDFVRLPTWQLFLLVMRRATHSDALNFAESHLEMNPSDLKLLGLYCAMSQDEDFDRCKTFLAKSLEDRPVRVEMHRMYQELSKLDHTEEQLVPQYQKYLDQDPKNSALLYLRGRLEEKGDAAVKYFDQAIAADKNNSYPYRAKAWQHEIVGEFKEANQLLEKAVSLSPKSEDLLVKQLNLKFAVGDFPAAERLAREALQNEPRSEFMQLYLFASLVKQRQQNQVNDYIRQLKQTLTQEGADLREATLAEMAFCYVNGDFATIKKLAGDLSIPAADLYKAKADLELGNVADALPQIHLDGPYTKGVTKLLTVLAWRSKGDKEKAQAAIQEALDEMKKSSRSDQAVAAILAEPSKATFKQFKELTIDSLEKAILLAVVAPDAPRDERKAILTLADKLNYQPHFPHHFMKRTIAKLLADAEK